MRQGQLTLPSGSNKSTDCFRIIFSCNVRIFFVHLGILVKVVALHYATRAPLRKRGREKWRLAFLRCTAHSVCKFFPPQTVYSFPDVQYVVCLSSPVISIFAHLCVVAVTFDPAMFALSSVSGICKAFELLTVSVVWYHAPADELVGHENNLSSQII